VISNTSRDGSAPVRASSRSITAISSGSPIEAAEMLISTSTPRAAYAAPWAMTQRSMSRIAPYFSAIGRKSPGGTRLPSAARMRISSSRWTVSPVTRSTIGCACSSKRSSANARRMSPSPPISSSWALSSASRALRSVMSTICANSTSRSPPGSRTGTTLTDAQTSLPSGRT
jgi:hypothetical protein